jgi:hypothetical protein
MPISLAKIKAGVAAFAWEYEGEILNVQYRTGEITPAELAQQAEQEGMAGLIGGLVKWLVSWDLLGEDGKPLPITAEALNLVPTPFLNGLYVMIMRDARPPEIKDRTSKGGSFTKG